MAKEKKDDDQIESIDDLDVEDGGGESGEKENPKSGPTPIALAVIGIVAFVIFLGIFSFMLGVFDKDAVVEGPEGTDAAQAHDSTSQASSGQASQYYQEGYEHYQPDTQVSFNFADAEAESDSMEEISWIEQEKKKIKAEQLELAVERRELESLKRQVQSLLQRKKQVETERIAYLAKLFDNMKKEEVGQLMEQLDDDTIVSVLPRMKAESASRVLAMLPPKRAARITTMLLGLGQ